MSRQRIAVKDFVAQIGARVRFLRYERGLTQHELAEMARCSVSCIMHLELGRRAVTIRILCKIARALHVQPFDILNHDTRKNDLACLTETMRLHPKLTKLARRMVTKLNRPRSRA